MSNELNDYQQQTRETLESFFRSAQEAKGKVLNWEEVRRIASYIQNLTRIIETAQFEFLSLENLLNAYTNEYGEELLNELLDDVEDYTHEEPIYAETIAQTEDGQDNEESGLHSSDDTEEE